MKLGLKHLAPYLPYKLKISKIHYLNTGEGIGSINHMLTTKSNNYKPILRPLSDYAEDYANFWNYSFRDFKWAIINKEVSVLCWYDLLSKHYDVFGLIEKGLAIDINTL